jgi:hypothetical protein
MRKLLQNNESTDKGIKKLFPGVLPKALQKLAKVCHPHSFHENVV